MQFKFHFWCFLLILLTLRQPVFATAGDTFHLKQRYVSAADGTNRAEQITETTNSRQDKLNRRFFTRFFINLLSVIVLVRLIYFRIYQNGEFVFTFFVFNTIIFLITYLLNQVDMSLGAAFGLFAVFSMLRYRTEGISAREMTYLFVVISVGLITAVSRGSVIELLIMNVLIIAFVFLLESDILIKRELCRTIQYDRIEYIVPEKRELMLTDLRVRTGLPIHRVSIGSIDFVKDTAALKAYYFEPKK